MASLWRISNYANLEGRGGEKFASRWSSLGKRIVYLAESPAGALLEVLVHLQFEADEIPDEYQLLEVEVPAGVEPRDLVPNPRSGWRDRISVSQRLGDGWLKSRESPIARVPSAIVPRTWNVLLNPLHPEASKVKVVSIIRERFDTRLLRSGVR